MVQSISQSHALCIQAFQRLHKATTDSAQCPEGFQLALLDQLDKYGIWSVNLGASHAGPTYQLSLDYRLRDATFYKDQVIIIVNTLQRHVSNPKNIAQAKYLAKTDNTQVENARQIVSGEREPFEDFSESDSDHESLCLSPSNDEPCGKGYDSPWESSSEPGLQTEMEICEAEPNANDKTSGLIPPATELAQLLEAIKLTISSLYKLPIGKPALVDGLKEDFADTISYDQSSFDCMQVQQKFPGLNSEVADRIGRHITRRRQLLLYLQKHQDFHLLRELQDESESASILTEEHVLSVLQPYICTFPDCDLGDHMFANRDAWFQHEMQMHRVEYFCNAEAHPVHRNLSDFKDHMKQAHNISHATLANPAAMNMFRHPTSSSNGICNFCSREQPVKRMKSHVSKHLEQISLFAIPSADYGGMDVDAGENQLYQAQHSLEESNSLDDEEESISLDDEKMESVSQGDEQESLSSSERYASNATGLFSQQYASNSRPINLEQYAANFQGGVLEAHADAFNPSVQQRQPPHQSNHGHDHSPYPDPSLSFARAPAASHRSAQPHHHLHSTIINPAAPTHSSNRAIPRPTSHHHKSTSTSAAAVNHEIGLPSPPSTTSTTGHAPHEQPRHARLPHSSSSSSSSSSHVCCGRSYGSKFTFDRHRRESRTCPHGRGGRRFVCYICANTGQSFARRASLQQHVREEHGRSREEANVDIDHWYGRYGEEKDYPDAVMDLDRPY